MMTRRYTHLIAVAVLIAAFRAPISAQQETVDELRAKAYEGQVRAQLILGSKYSTGGGVPQDAVEAVRWYRLAADQGDALAQYGLGRMYATGSGVPQADVQAHIWLNLGSSKMTGENRETMIKYRDNVAARLTAEQLVEGQRLAREWDAAHPRR